MEKLNAYLNFTTIILTSGLTLLAVNPANAQSWSRTLLLESDSYSDTRNPGSNFGGSEYLQIGNFQGGNDSGDEQRAYLSWNIEDLIGQLPPGSQVRNLSATLFLSQTNNDPNNDNDPNRNFAGVPRVTIDGLAVTGDWNENSPIDPSMPPTTSDPNEDENAPFATLFSGQINQGTQNNDFRGDELNRFITTVLNNNLDNNTGNDSDVVSIALRSNNSLNFPNPFRIFPVESIFSKEGDVDLQPRLEISFDVGIEGHKTEDGPNFTFFSRAGREGRRDWEVSLGTKSEGGDTFVDESDPDRYFTWENRRNVPFELTCNTATNLVTLELDNDSSRTTSFTANNCQDIEGLKIFAVAKETTNTIAPGTAMRIVVNQVREVGGPIQNVSGFSVLSRAGLINEDTGTERVEDSFFFTDSVDDGGLGLTNGINLVRGIIRMDWGQEAPNPQEGNVGSRIQTQLTPLVNVDDTNPPPPSFSPTSNQPESDAACSVVIPDELFSAISSENPTFLVDDSICANSSVSTNNQTVPEPNSILGFILLGSTGIGVRLFKKIAS